MTEEILVCLDGSLLAEKILAFAEGVAAAQGATLSLFNVVKNSGELTDLEHYLRNTAKCHGAEIKIAVAKDPARGR